MKKYIIGISFIALLLLVACSNNEKDEVEDVEEQEFFEMIESLDILFDEEITNNSQ